jgi:hypothetical protein
MANPFKYEYGTVMVNWLKTRRAYNKSVSMGH